MLIQTVAEAIERGGTGPAGSNVPYRGTGQPCVMLAGPHREFAGVPQSRAQPCAQEMVRAHKLHYLPQAPLRRGNRLPRGHVVANASLCLAEGGQNW